MTQYAGLCIGGPLDGQMLVAQHDQTRVEERTPAPAISPTPHSPIPSTMVCTTHTYLWHDVHGVGLWVPGNATITEAINGMASLYAQEAKA